MKRIPFVPALLCAAIFAIFASTPAFAGEDVGCSVPGPIPVPTLSSDGATAVSEAMMAVNVKLTARTEAQKGDPQRAVKRVAKVLQNHPELVPTEIGADKQMSPVRGWTEVCKQATSSAGEEYCNVELNQMCWRSSSVQAMDCSRYSWDQTGQYATRVTMLFRWRTDCNGGGGPSEDLRGRFYVGEDGSVVVRPKDGSVLFFDPDLAPCAETGDDSYRRYSQYRDYTWNSHFVPATSNVTHGDIVAKPWVGLYTTYSSETLWEGAEACWQQ